MNPLEFTATGDYLGGPVEAHPSMSGFSAVRRNAGLVHDRRVMEASRLYADVLTGRSDPILLREAINPRHEFIVNHLMEQYPGLYPSNGHVMGLREAMAVTDYQALYVDVLDRMYYGYYSAFPITTLPLVKKHQLRDTRTVSRYLLDGVVSPLTVVEPGAPAPERNLFGPTPQNGATLGAATSTAPQQYTPKVYQAATSVNWNAFLNDDLGIFNDLSNRLAISGNMGIAKFITTQFVDANGPHASLYTTAYKNIINTTNGASLTNPPLSPQGIIDGLKVIARMRDSANNPIMVTGGMYLVYGPALKGIAETLLNQTKVMLVGQDAGAVAETTNFPRQWVEANAWMIRDMTPIMDPWMPIVCTTSGVQDTMWYIVVDPGTQNRPAVEFGQLNGFETPQIFQKVPNTQRLGGGVDPTMGDFYTMNQELKIVTVMGALQVDGRSTVASKGSGS